MNNTAFLFVCPKRLWERAPHKQNQRREKTTVARIGERTLGVDYGVRRVGLAISVGVAPRPLQRIDHQDNPYRVATDVAQVASRNLAESIVVGMPVDIYGRELRQAITTRNFVQELIRCAPWAKIMVLNETFTSKDAIEQLRGSGIVGKIVKDFIDSESAVMLLQRHYSDMDDYKAELVHEPKVATTQQRPSEERMTYAEWKKQIMKRAAQNVQVSKKNRKK
ncbi:unnamed protein product [Agarophyton chilense]